MAPATAILTLTCTQITRAGRKRLGVVHSIGNRVPRFSGRAGLQSMVRAVSPDYSYRDDDRPLNVVLLSDGMTQPGEQAELIRLVQSRPVQ